MAIVKVMKRRDASSVVVAVVVAMILSQAITSLTMELASKLSGINEGPFNGAASAESWRLSYVLPLVTAALQLLALELLIWLYSFVKDFFSNKK